MEKKMLNELAVEFSAVVGSDVYDALVSNDTIEDAINALNFLIDEAKRVIRALETKTGF